MEYKKRFPEKKFLWYVCCGPEYPNSFIRSNLLECRFFGILTSLIKLDGFLRWNYTVWPENPREDIRYGGFPAGDTNFVYPSFGGDVLLSLRYKQFQYGIEDFELLTELKKRGLKDVTAKVYSLLCKAKDFGSYYYPENLALEDICSLDYSDYSKARELMLNALSCKLI